MATLSSKTPPFLPREMITRHQQNLDRQDSFDDMARGEQFS